ncbi:hypothetical protein LSTR_LSTR010692 [Laodelphax striatellus]|uniref:Odorant receptor n=1 Tax=Laodelphax striatellus TaxID=195883 RepID=A0A482WTT6_LAOST|nr:hypothetical protein LSTR_LSTR010692 [Laodelphax striatellus]
MESTRFLLKFTNLVRYGTPLPLNSLPLLSAIIAVSLLFTNLFMVILYEHDSTERRLKAMAEIVSVTSVFSCVVQRGLKPEYAIKLIELIEGELLEDCRILSVGRIKWERIYANYDKKRADMERLYRKMFMATTGIYFAYIGRNAFNQLLEGKNTSERKWPTPYIYWCPPGYDSYYIFIFLEILHIYVFSFMLAEAFCLMLSTCLATERVLADFQTIYMLIEDLSENFMERHIEFNQNYLQSNQEIECDSKNVMRDLENYMSLLIQCHQKLNSNFKYCAEYSAFGTLAITFPISVDTVISIYTMMKATNVKVFVNFAVACFFINLIILFCYHNGQKIVNQILKAAFSYGNIIYSVKSNK